MDDLFDITDLTKTWSDNEPILFILILTVVFIFVTVLALRLLLPRSQRLTSDACPICRTPMRRVHQIRSARLLATVIPLRTLYCSRCEIKRVRVRPYGVVAKKPGL